MGHYHLNVWTMEFAIIVIPMSLVLELFTVTVGEGSQCHCDITAQWHTLMSLSLLDFMERVEF